MTDREELWSGHLDEPTRHRLAIDTWHQEELVGTPEEYRERLMTAHIPAKSVWNAIILAMPLTAQQFSKIRAENRAVPSLDQCYLLLQVLLPLDDTELFLEMREIIYQGLMVGPLFLSQHKLAQMHPLKRELFQRVPQDEEEVDFLITKWAAQAQSWKLASLMYNSPHCHWCDAVQAVHASGLHIPPCFAAVLMTRISFEGGYGYTEIPLGTVLWDSLRHNQTDILDMFVECRVAQTFQESPFEFDSSESIMRTLRHVESPEGRDSAMDQLCVLCSRTVYDEHDEKLSERMISFVSRVPNKLTLLIQWMYTVKSTDRWFRVLHHMKTPQLDQEGQADVIAPEEDLKALYRKKYPLSPMIASKILKSLLADPDIVEYGCLIEALRDDLSRREALLCTPFLKNLIVSGTANDINHVLDIGGAEKVSEVSKYWLLVLTRRDPEVLQIFVDRWNLEQLEEMVYNPFLVICEADDHPEEPYEVGKERVFKCAEIVFKPSYLEPSSIDGKNCLHIASRAGNLPMVEYLLSRPEAPAMIVHQDFSGDIPLFACIYNEEILYAEHPSDLEFVHVTKKLLDATPAGAIRMANHHGETAFHLAMKVPLHSPVAGMLIDLMEPADTLVLQRKGRCPIGVLISKWAKRYDEECEADTAESESILLDLVRRLLELGGGEQLTAGHSPHSPLYHVCRFFPTTIAVRLVELFAEYADMTNPGDDFIWAVKNLERDEEERLWATLIKHQIVSLEQFQSMCERADLPGRSLGSLKRRVESEVHMMQSKSAQSSSLGKRNRS